MSTNSESDVPHEQQLSRHRASGVNEAASSNKAIRQHPKTLSYVETTVDKSHITVVGESISVSLICKKHLLEATRHHNTPDYIPFWKSSLHAKRSDNKIMQIVAAYKMKGSLGQCLHPQMY